MCCQFLGILNEMFDAHTLDMSRIKGDGLTLIYCHLEDCKVVFYSVFVFYFRKKELIRIEISHILVHIMTYRLENCSNRDMSEPRVSERF